jgi:Flp pilus assembly pilin Flp
MYRSMPMFPSRTSLSSVALGGRTGYHHEARNRKGDDMLALYVRVQLWRANAFGSEEGATAVEYALMIALIALVVMGAVMFLGESTDSSFQNSVLLDGLS